MAIEEHLKKAVDLINKSANVLVTTHIRPDGDACGCCVAMFEMLTALGKKAKMVFLTEVPQWYEFLFEQQPPVLGKDLKLAQLQQADFDLIVILDTNSYSQLNGIDKFLKQNKKPVLVIDHHVTSDGLGDVEVIDSSAAAAALIVFDLFKYAGWPLTKKIAEALFAAVATDTGWFQFTNTDSRTFRTCAELIDAGADAVKAHRDLYQNFTPARFKLMTAMLNTLQLHFDGRFAVQQILQSDFKRTGARHSDTENLIDQCRVLSSVEAAALFIELEDGRIRCSLRSNGNVDVSKIAQKFGGGGHKAAAGTYLSGPIESAKQSILAEMEQQFKPQSSADSG